MKKGLILISIWASISVFTQTDIWHLWQEMAEYPDKISMVIEQIDYEPLSDMYTGEPILPSD